MSFPSLKDQQPPLVFNMFHSVLLVVEIAGTRLAQVEGNC